MDLLKGYPTSGVDVVSVGIRYFDICKILKICVCIIQSEADKSSKSPNGGYTLNG